MSLHPFHAAALRNARLRLVEDSAVRQNLSVHLNYDVALALRNYAAESMVRPETIAAEALRAYLGKA
jgi:hypothetical protein